MLVEMMKDLEELDSKLLEADKELEGGIDTMRQETDEGMKDKLLDAIVELVSVIADVEKLRDVISYRLRPYWN